MSPKNVHCWPIVHYRIRVLLDRPALLQRQPHVPPRFVLGAALAAVLLVGIEVVCARLHLSGPTVLLLRSYVFEEPAAPGIYCGLALMLVLLRPRLRWLALGSAVTIDLVLAVARLLLHGHVRSFGSGALIVLTALAGYAVLRLRGIEQVNALRGLACGAALVAATTMGNVWLEITAQVRPMVLDEYVEVADRALGSPSWAMGELFEVLGTPGHYLFLAVYSMLPLTAVFVAVVQLRRGWLRHNVMLTFIALGALGPAIYLLFPVVGPVYAFGSAGGPFALSTQWAHQVPSFSVAQPLRFDNFTPRNCMPSLHTAWAVILFVHTRSMSRWMRVLGAVWLLGTLAATLGFGYHYGVDLVVGAVFALTVEAAMQSRVQGWDRARVQLVAYGSAVVTALLLGVRYGTTWIGADPVMSGVLILGALGAMVAGFYRLTAAQRPVLVHRSVRPSGVGTPARAPFADAGQIGRTIPR